MKIEKVIIEGFRAYKSKKDGTFDFTADDGQCADFVAIYAPNGFGKSSFYDAVEWALTNNISRYLVSSQRNNNNKTSIALNIQGEYQFILRNNQIAVNSTSRVIVQTADFSYINWVPKIKRGSRDYKFDPKDTFEGTDAFSDIFLSQDAIDSFIKEVRPEDRYKKFMQQFDIADENYRSELFIANNTNENKISQLKEELVKLKGLIDAPVDEKILATINSTITDLNSINKEATPIEPVGATFSPEDEAALNARITEKLVSTQNKISHLTTLGKELQELISSENSFYLQDGEKNETSSKILHYRKRLDLSDRLQNLKTHINRIEERIKVGSIEAAKEKEIEKIIPYYFELTKQIDTYGAEKESLHNIIKEKSRSTQEQESKIIEIEAELLSIEEALSKLLLSEQNIPIVFNDINAKSIAIQKLRQNIEIEHSSWSEANFEKNSIKSKLEWLSSLASAPVEKIEAHLDLLDVDNFLKESILLIIEEKLSLSKELELAEDWKSSLQEHASKVSNLIGIGYEIVRQGDTTTCPLCKSKFNSFEELSAALLDDNILTTAQNNAFIDIARIENAIDAVTSNEKDILDKVYHGVRSEIAVLESQLKHTNENIESLFKKIAKTSSTITQYESQIESLNNQVFWLDEKAYKTKLKEDRDRLLGRKINLREQSDVAKEKIFSLTDQKNEHSLKVENIEKLILDLKSSPQITQVIAFSETLKVPPQALSESLRLRSKSRNELDVNLKRELNESRKKLAYEFSSLETEFSDNERNELTLEISRLQERLQELEFFLAPYQNILTKLQISPPPNLTPQSLINIFKTETRLISENRSKAEAEIEKYNILSLQIPLLIPFFQRNSAKESALLTSSLLSRHEVIKSRLEKDYNLVVSHLEKKIRNFFSTDLINEIYKKIDPHPEFKKIEFRCNFNGDNGPRLEVFLKDEAERLNAPSFHFSSAQLNILSLSIFLARAVNAQTGDSSINTILIDDPIHSMDSINILSTIDILRNISKNLDKQIIISTHDENFFRLLKKKVPEQFYRSKFIELETYGKVASKPNKLASRLSNVKIGL